MRRNGMTRSIGLLGALSLPLALVACSSAGGSSGGDLTYEDSPLAEAFSGMDAFAGQSEEEMQAEYAQQEMRVQELTAECMAEQGFEYIPVDPASYGGVSFSEDEEFDPESEDYISQYGYGITTYDEEMAEEIPEEDIPEDPNMEIVDAMSQAEQEAYYEALYGPMPTEEEIDSDEAIEWEPQGCSGEAQQAVYMGEDQNPWEDPQFQELMDAINTFYEDLENAPEFAELDAEWSSCMADAGYAGFAKQRDAEESIWTDADAIWSAQGGSGEVDETAMTELREREIATALADFSCRQQTDYRQRQLEVQFEKEQEFVDQWREEIDAMVAAYNQQSSPEQSSSS